MAPAQYVIFTMDGTFIFFLTVRELVHRESKSARVVHSWLDLGGTLSQSLENQGRVQVQVL